MKEEPRSLRSLMERVAMGTAPKNKMKRIHFFKKMSGHFLAGKLFKESPITNRDFLEHIFLLRLLGQKTKGPYMDLIRPHHCCLMKMSG